MKVTKFVMMLSVFWLLSIQSRCKKEEEDDCANQGFFKAGFTVGEMVGDSLVATDTIMNVNFQLAVRADQKYDSIKWRIGDDSREYTNQQTVKLNFRPEFAGEKLKVTLFARGKPHFVCALPSYDDGLDTVVKYFTIACNPSFSECRRGTSKLSKAQLYMGKWRGSDSDNPSREFDVQIVDLGDDPNSLDDTMFYNLRVYNLPESCGGPQDFLNSSFTACGGKVVNPFFFAPEIQEFGYNGFYLDGKTTPSGCCGQMKMFGIVDKKDINKIIIYQTPKTGLKKTFIGRRL